MNEEAINNLIKNVEERPYGEIIPHHEISGILKLSKRDAKYHHLISRANRTLTEKGKRLQNRFNIGYVVLNPDDYVDEAQSQYRRGVRRAKEAMRVITYAPVALMSAEAANRFNMIEQRIKSVVATVVGGLTEIKLLNRRKVNINN